MARRSGAVLCTRCRRLVASSERVCPHCGAVQPSLFGVGPAMQALFRDAFEPVSLISAAAVALYVGSIALDPSEAMGRGGLFSIGSPSFEALRRLGMTGAPNWQAGQVWTVLTSLYLHGSLLHIFFNLSWVRSLGPLGVEIFGPARFFVLYTVSGAGGMLASNLLWCPPTIGASGAIFGLYGALLVYGKRRGGTVGAAVSRQATAWAAAGLILSLAFPAVNNVAHLGGLVTGAIAARLMPYAERRQEARGSQLAALILLGLTIAGFLASAAAWVRG